MELSARLLRVRETLRSSLWFAPSLAVMCALVAALALDDVEVASDGLLSRWVFAGGPDGARAVLQVIAGSVMTVMSVTFSLTVLALQNASNQYSPRVLSTFLRDRTQQVVLSIFLATFTFCIVVLRSVRSADGGIAAVVPSAAVTVAVLLGLASLAALVVFIHHVTQSLRLESVLEGVTNDTLDAVRALQHPPGEPDAVVGDVMPRPPSWAQPVRAPGSGVVQAVHVARLLEAAADHGVVVCFDRGPGDHAVADTVLGWVWPVTGGPDRIPDEMVRLVAEAVQLGGDRTIGQDVAYGLRQLTDVALRALSPGVNDPTTAVDALRRVAVVLGALAAAAPLGPRSHTDDRGRALVWVPQPTFDAHLQMVVPQILHYGGSDHTVVVALLEALGDVGAVAGDPVRVALVREQVETVLERAEQHLTSSVEVEIATDAAERTRARLAGSPAEAAVLADDDRGHA